MKTFIVLLGLVLVMSCSTSKITTNDLSRVGMLDSITYYLDHKQPLQAQIYANKAALVMGIHGRVVIKAGGYKMVFVPSGEGAIVVTRFQ